MDTGQTVIKTGERDNVQVIMAYAAGTHKGKGLTELARAGKSGWH